MKRAATTLSRPILTPLAAGFGAAVLLSGLFTSDQFAFGQEPAAPPQVDATKPQTDVAAPAPAASGQPPADPTADLSEKRDQTRRELEALSQTLSLSDEKAKQLQDSIASLDKSNASRRKAMDREIRDSEAKITDLKVKEDGIRRSLHERRGLLAEVLAALERMGRNPPPALLVSPDDALASVRSAILLGAVVPGIRKETDKLAADLANLSALQTASAAEKAALT